MKRVLIILSFVLCAGSLLAVSNSYLPLEEIQLSCSVVRGSNCNKKPSRMPTILPIIRKVGNVIYVPDELIGYDMMIYSGDTLLFNDVAEYESVLPDSLKGVYIIKFVNESY